MYSKLKPLHHLSTSLFGICLGWSLSKCVFVCVCVCVSKWHYCPFVDIGGIVNHHCLDFFFMIYLSDHQEHYVLSFMIG